MLLLMVGPLMLDNAFGQSAGVSTYRPSLFDIVFRAIASQVGASLWTALWAKIATFLYLKDTVSYFGAYIVCFLTGLAMVGGVIALFLLTAANGVPLSTAMPLALVAALVITLTGWTIGFRVTVGASVGDSFIASLLTLLVQLTIAAILYGIMAASGVDMSTSRLMRQGQAQSPATAPVQQPSESSPRPAKPTPLAQESKLSDSETEAAKKQAAEILGSPREPVTRSISPADKPLATSPVAGNTSASAQNGLSKLAQLLHGNKATPSTTPAPPNGAVKAVTPQSVVAMPAQTAAAMPTAATRTAAGSRSTMKPVPTKAQAGSITLGEDMFRKHDSGPTPLPQSSTPNFRRQR